MPVTRANPGIAHSLAVAAPAHSAMADIQRADDALRKALESIDARRDRERASALGIYHTHVAGALDRYLAAMNTLEAEADADEDEED